MIDTKSKIINAAIELFSSTPYGDVSILQISKKANVSNGIVYKYFKNKEDLFTYLLNIIVDKIQSELQYIVGETLEERLKNFIELNIKLTEQEATIIKIFRDGQYRFIEYEKKIKKGYLKSLEKVFQRKLNSYETIYILGSIRFINISYHSRKLTYNYDLLVNILLNGFLNPTKIDVQKIYNSDFYERIILNSDNLKHQILKKGEKLFGEREYHDVKVKDITKKLEISIGSFYSFFETKEEFLSEIVEKLKKEILFLLKDNYCKETNLNEMHTTFLYIFIEYFKKSIHKYKLIRDVEFLNFDIFIDFLNKIENFYIETLTIEGISYEDKRLMANILLGLQHYMGIEIFFINSFKDQDKFLEKMSYYLSNGIIN